jgi:hypothetical protein
MAHRLDQIVDSLFAQENDRALARAWVARLEADGVGERTEALLREAALTTKRAEGSEMTQVQAREYLSDFARTIGVSIAWSIAARQSRLRHSPMTSRSSAGSGNRTRRAMRR